MPGGTTVPYKKTKHKTFNAFCRKAASGQYQTQGRDRGSQGVSSAGVRKAGVQGHRAGASAGKKARMRCREGWEEGIQQLRVVGREAGNIVCGTEQNYIEKKNSFNIQTQVTDNSKHEYFKMLK